MKPSLLMRSAAVAVFTAAAILTPLPALAQAAAGSDEAAIRAAVRTFEAGWNSHDMDAMFQAFAPDAEFVNIVGMFWRGLPEVKLAHQRMHASTFKATPNHIEDLQVRVVAPDAAIAVVRWQKGAFTPPDGVVRPPSRDVMSMFFVKRDGRWLVAGAHNTPLDEEATRFNPVGRPGP